MTLSAKEAREKTKLVIENRNNQLKTGINNRIGDAIKMGEFSITIAHALPKDIVEYFRGYHYLVNYYDKDGETIISW